MKAFFERYSYECVRMLLNQVAISIFGFALAMTAINIGNDGLLLGTSIAAIIFYLALTYGNGWKMGAGDKVGVEYGKRKYNPFIGLLVSLVANSINLILAILITVGTLAGVEGLTSISRMIALLAQGMYQGLLATVQLNGAYLNSVWWAYFLITIPAMLVATVSYIAGVKDIHVTKLGVPELPESDRPSRKELKEQRELERKSRK